ncbi:MAG: hypothetical protein RRC07_15440 [Anaerolineae bacterium]|nr:hypothetical protein [Anaerolineae bacterium]
MKRKTVFPHRTAKMREDFLDWLRQKAALKRQVERDQFSQVDATVAPALHAWADDGGAVPGVVDDNLAVPQRRQFHE